MSPRGFSLLSVFMMLLCYGCKGGSPNQQPKELATPGNPLTSPCGHFILEVDRLWDNRSPFFQIQVLEYLQNGEVKPVYKSEMKFYERFTNYFLWDGQSRVWVYSGDRGTFVVFPNAQGRWELHSYVDLNHEVFNPPALLRKLRPKLFRGTASEGSGGMQSARTRWDEIDVLTALGDVPQIGHLLKDWNTVGEVRYRHLRQDHLDEYYASGHSTQIALSTFFGSRVGCGIDKESRDELLVEEIAKALDMG